MLPLFLDDLHLAALGLPADRPFTPTEARDLGLDPWTLRQLREAGVVVAPIHGVYHVAALVDCLDLRLACLRLVVPADAVICDRTAGWLHGAPRILAPGSHLEVPRVSCFLPRRGHRLRSKLTESGSRDLGREDIVEIGGFRVTSGLRTACDLGRLLHRDQALAALDSLLRGELFSRDELLHEIRRFKGMRFVTQLRELAPLADGRSQSPGESILRLRWIDCGDLPMPDLQVEVPTPWGSSYWLDLGVAEFLYAGEYDGPEWHGDERTAHDLGRRGWISENEGWEIDVFVGANIHGPHQDAEIRLRRALLPLIARARTTTYVV